MPALPESVRDPHFRQLNGYRDDPAYQALDGYEQRIAFFAGQVGHKWEIDAAIYDEFLDLLPPLAYRADSFCMSEVLFDRITHRYARVGDRYFCEVVTWPPCLTSTPAAASMQPRKAEHDS